MVLAIKEKLEADNEEKISRPEAESEMKRMLEVGGLENFEVKKKMKMHGLKEHLFLSFVVGK